MLACQALAGLQRWQTPLQAGGCTCALHYLLRSCLKKGNILCLDFGFAVSVDPSCRQQLCFVLLVGCFLAAVELVTATRFHCGACVGTTSLTLLWLLSLQCACCSANILRAPHVLHWPLHCCLERKVCSAMANSPSNSTARSGCTSCHRPRHDTCSCHRSAILHYSADACLRTLSSPLR